MGNWVLNTSKTQRGQKVYLKIERNLLNYGGGHMYIHVHSHKYNIRLGERIKRVNKFHSERYLEEKLLLSLLTWQIFILFLVTNTAIYSFLLHNVVTPTTVSFIQILTWENEKLLTQSILGHRELKNYENSSITVLSH